jgi:tryptophanase
MEKVIRDLTGCDHILPTHQGRAAERILYGYLGGEGKIFISNTHFDTTRANIEYSGAQAIDLPVPEAANPSLELPFKGNLDLVKLEETIKKHGPSKISGVILTVTNNSGGGQPVSMENARAVRHICKSYGILYLMDICRIAENSYFIHQREDGFKGKSFKGIAKEMLSLADGIIMSAKPMADFQEETWKL